MSQMKLFAWVFSEDYEYLWYSTNSFDLIQPTLLLLTIPLVLNTSLITELLCDKVSKSWILRFINLLFSEWFFQDYLSPMIKLSLLWIKVKVRCFTSKRRESTLLLLTYQIMISLCDSMLLVLWKEERSKICWTPQLLLATLFKSLDCYNAYLNRIGWYVAKEVLLLHVLLLLNFLL